MGQAFRAAATHCVVARIVVIFYVVALVPPWALEAKWAFFSGFCRPPLLPLQIVVFRVSLAHVSACFFLLVADGILAPRVNVPLEDSSESVVLLVLGMPFLSARSFWQKHARTCFGYILVPWESGAAMLAFVHPRQQR